MNPATEKFETCNDDTKWHQKHTDIFSKFLMVFFKDIKRLQKCNSMHCAAIYDQPTNSQQHAVPDIIRHLIIPLQNATLCYAIQTAVWWILRSVFCSTRHWKNIFYEAMTYYHIITNPVFTA